MSGFDRDELGPYGSALDLPSMVEMRQQLQAFKLLTRFFMRHKRVELLELEEQVQNLAEIVDRFYALLGPRNWIFHDQLDTKSIQALIELPAERAERALIEIYKTPDTLRFALMTLNRFPELRARMTQIEQAKTDYLEGRYSSTVQTLLSVMDGFVNDVEKDQRRGLHTRDAEEMTAWDSVVGHHMGLTHAHKSFTKSFKKTVTEEVFELYRHGIVHGMVINFNNDVVATKAWNRLFAVADWAASRQKQNVPPKPQAGWRELVRSLDENRKTKEALERWSPSESRVSDVGFEDDEVVQLSAEYLRCWQSKNFGRMAELLAPLVAEPTISQSAGMLRRDSGSTLLDGFSLERVVHKAAAVAEVDVRLVVDGEAKDGRMRWIRSDSTGMAISPNQEGSWGLMNWTPQAMINER